MARNHGAHPAWLLPSSIWRFCYSSYRTPKLKNIILPITFSPLISNFYQFVTWNFFALVNQLKVFLEIGRNDMSTTITIISNITDYCVTVTQSYIPWIFYMPMSHVSVRSLIQLPTPPFTPHHPNMSSLGLLFYRNTLPFFFCSDYCKNSTFSK